MSRVILQPTGNKDAREHYVDTLLRPVDISRIKPYVSKAELDRLNEIYPSGLVPTWGVTPGVNGVNVNKWEKIRASDLTFFSASGVLYSHAFVTYKIHNAALAKHLWGFNAKGETWEYIYFLDEIKEHEIPISKFNAIVGYSEKFKVQGFSVLDDEKSNSLLSYFDLRNDAIIESVSHDEYQELINNFDLEALDIEGKTKSRAEQSFLRNVLFRNKTKSTCGICENEYPISMLVAAHIKKRAFCSSEEKLDYQNIVMPMCKFGCDDLFEKGFIAVIEGRVSSLNRITTLAVEDYIKKIEGLHCSHWNTNTAKYFEWHLAYHSKTLPNWIY